MASPTWKAFDGCLIQRDEDEDRAKVGRLVGKIEDTHAELASHPKNNLTHIQDNTANTVEPLEALRVEQTKRSWCQRCYALAEDSISSQSMASGSLFLRRLYLCRAIFSAASLASSMLRAYSGSLHLPILAS